MSIPGRPTYGALITQALLEIAAAWDQPNVLAGPATAITAAQARHSLYRGLTRVLAVHTTEASSADSAHPIGEHDRTLLAQLQAELAASAAATRPALDLPIAQPRPQPEPASAAGHLGRASETAGRAWDLLATRRTADRSPRGSGSQPIRDVSRGVLADAVQIARGIAGLDAKLEPAMWRAAIAADTPYAARPVLVRVAEDCQRTTRIGLPTFARDVATQLSHPLRGTDWTRVDTVTAVAQPAAIIDTPAAAAAAIDTYGSWLVRHRHRLTVTDLASLASTGSRLTGLVVSAGAECSAAGARDAVEAWRRCHHALRPLRSIHPPPAGYRQPRLIAGWADRHIRDGLPTQLPDPTQATWTKGVRAIAARLPDLADAGADSLSALLASGQILAPASNPSRYLYLPVPAHDQAVLAAVDHFAAAAKASAALTPPTLPAGPAAARPAAHLARQAFPAPVTAAINLASPAQQQHPPASSQHRRPRRSTATAQIPRRSLP